MLPATSFQRESVYHVRAAAAVLLLLCHSTGKALAQEAPKFGQGPGTYDLERSEEFTLDRAGRPECDTKTEALYRDCLGTDSKLRGAINGREVSLKSTSRGRKFEVKASARCTEAFKLYSEKCVFEESDQK